MARVENPDELAARAVERAIRRKAKQREYYRKNKVKISNRQKQYYRDNIGYYSDYRRRPENKAKHREDMRTRRVKQKFVNQMELPFAKEA